VCYRRRLRNSRKGAAALPALRVCSFSSKAAARLVAGLGVAVTREEQPESPRQGCVEFSSHARRELDTRQAGRAPPKAGQVSAPRG
jgi:hypothetical protein